jgi:hypothetical protein
MIQQLKEYWDEALECKRCGWMEGCVRREEHGAKS